MEYKGVVDKGLIRPFEPIEFPDGTEVTFHEAGNGSATPSVSADAAAWRSMDARFWQGFSIEGLAEEQGVTPLTSLDELAGEWPEGDDIDEFLQSLREWRR
jgi:hypothetical protein